MSRRRPALLLVLLALLSALAAVLPAAPVSARPAADVLTASLTSPTAGQTISGTVTLTAMASRDTVGVEYFVDADAPGHLINVSTTGPIFPVTWDSTKYAGAHTIVAVATNGFADGTPAAGVPVTIANPTPTVRVVSPAPGSVTGTNPAFTVIATPAPGGFPIDHVSYYLDSLDPSAKLDASSTSPYGLTLHVPTGAHTIYLLVIDTKDKNPAATPCH